MSVTPVNFRRKPAPPPERRVDRDAVAFQPDATMIEETPLPRVARSSIYIVAALVVTAALWATFSYVDRVVTARGKLVTIDPLIVVQPLETAIIRTINVGVGDSVKAGAVLATLDPTFTESQETANRERLNSMRAEERRLAAEVGELVEVVLRHDLHQALGADQAFRDRVVA